MENLNTGIQNIRILSKAAKKRGSGANALIVVDFGGKKPGSGPFSSVARAATHLVNQMTTLVWPTWLCQHSSTRNQFSLEADF
jgi:hypothetical protein